MTVFLDWIIWGTKTHSKSGPHLPVASHLHKRTRKKEATAFCLLALALGRKWFHSVILLLRHSFAGVRSYFFRIRCRGKTWMSLGIPLVSRMPKYPDCLSTRSRSMLDHPDPGCVQTDKSKDWGKRLLVWFKSELPPHLVRVLEHLGPTWWCQLGRFYDSLAVLGELGHWKQTLRYYTRSHFLFTFRCNQPTSLSVPCLPHHDGMYPI